MKIVQSYPYHTPRFLQIGDIYMVAILQLMNQYWHFIPLKSLYFIPFPLVFTWSPFSVRRFYKDRTEHKHHAFFRPSHWDRFWWPVTVETWHQIFCGPSLNWDCVMYFSPLERDSVFWGGKPQKLCAIFIMSRAHASNSWLCWHWLRMVCDSFFSTRKWLPSPFHIALFRNQSWCAAIGKEWEILVYLLEDGVSSQDWNSSAWET